jgi:hypothetical protein
VQRTQQQIEDDPLTQTDLEQLEDAFQQMGKKLHGAAKADGGVHPAFNELIDLNTNMVSLLAEAERRGDQPLIDDIQELAQLFYEEMMSQDPNADPDEVSLKALVAAQNVISEQLNAYRMGVYDPLVAQQQQQPVDESVYYDRLLRYYEIRTRLGMQSWQHQWALEVGAGATIVTTGLLHIAIVQPFTFLANWFQGISPFVPWESIHLPFLGHTPLGGLLSWTSTVMSSASNFLVSSLGSLCQYLSGFTVLAELTAGLIVGILAFTVTHLYLRFIHTRKLRVGLPIGHVQIEDT